MKGYMTKEKFQKYVGVQKSGVVNMWDVKSVMGLTDLSKEEVIDIMKNYGYYKDKYLKVSE